MVNNSPDSHARSQRACDNCRKRKSRCSGRKLPENKCSSCIALNLPCLTTQSGRKRPPPPGYVEGLEETIEKLRKILITVKPDFDINDLEELTQMPPSPPTPAPPRTGAFTKDLITNVIRSIGSKLPTDHDGSEGESDDEAAHLVFPRDNTEPATHPLGAGVYGKSSGAFFARQIMHLKCTEDTDPSSAESMQFWRESFWTPAPWEIPPQVTDTGAYPFPDDDLLHSLLDLYFQDTGTFFPIFHKPTVERMIEAKEHLTDRLFGANVMLMCCVASRFSDDPRVLWDLSSPRRSSGWRWFHQTQAVKGSTLFNTISLGEVQYACLCSLFTSGSNVSLTAWISCGIGLRMAQFAGAHRHLSYGRIHTVENELWKRTFWALLIIDIYHSGAMGRPCVFFQMDLDFPTECDDQYMEASPTRPAFQQPEDKPSHVAFFSRFIHLMQILSFVLRTVYSLKRLKTHLGANNADWEEHLVTELDSAMNKWMDNVPPHLRWDPNIEDDTFFDQSAVLYGNFYFLQILIHRPFIAFSDKPSSLNFPSLLICANAARACCHIAEQAQKRKGVPVLLLQLPVFTSGLIMLMNLWIKRRSSKTSLNLNKEMIEVHKCIKILEACEDSWQAAGRLKDILKELSAAGNLPLPKEQILQSPSSSSNGTASPAPSAPESENIASMTFDPRALTAWDSMFDTNVGFPNFGLHNQFPSAPFDDMDAMPGQYPTNSFPSYNNSMGSSEPGPSIPFPHAQDLQNSGGLFDSGFFNQPSNSEPENWQAILSQLISTDAGANGFGFGQYGSGPMPHMF